MKPIRIAIIGAGPWGLAVLDRLITHARADQTISFRVKIYDPSQPGPGMHDRSQPNHLLLNTVTEQVDSFSAKHFGTPALPGAMTFLEWVRSQSDPDCPAQGFLPRRIFGAYLRFVYDTLKNCMPANIDLEEHRSAVTRIDTQADSLFWLYDTESSVGEFDHVFVCTGHGIETKEAIEFRDGSLAPYPIADFSKQVSSAKIVGIQGMGLTAVDIVSTLTEGRGGRFHEKDDAKLVYEPSGTEPIMYCFSRSGTPFSCRPASSPDLTSSSVPLFCRSEMLPKNRALDFTQDVLPLLVAEMWSAFALRHVSLTSGVVLATTLQYQLSKHLPEFATAMAREIVGEAGRNFDPEALLLGAGPSENDIGAPTAVSIKNHLKHDVAEAQKGESNSPYKYAIEMLRVNRDFIRDAVSHGRLTSGSRVMFFSRIAPRITQLIVGPPLSRGREWLALAEAGFLRFDLAMNPVLERDNWYGHWIARSDGNNGKRVVHLHKLIRAHMTAAAHPNDLLQNLAASGLCARTNTLGLRYFHTDMNDCPIDSTGRRVSGITMLGVPTEGSTYFNSYLPSPRSRARAFDQADRAIEMLLRNAAMNESVAA
ncbi:FAD/NAD(P)-binding protein [Parasedimentitalea maritima]|uniref:FAD/NAD(P)-binding protein n=1 Tax=Parasedimentitalea maritima TaxID=2578117 RepID=A0ABY2UQ93_9RHOB|nr:FAD/NAD(P)-binding protein [Zongyanglinia marina]TLP55338.1 FAD/NAD(P)-binding protein [Zongyanglinia marina]